MKLNYMLGVGIVLSLVGVSLLLAFGFLYLKPYLSVVNFIETRCTTASMLLLNDFLVPCECAADGSSLCHSQYPCVRASVNFQDTLQHRSIDNVTLYDSYETYFLQHSTLQCSYHKCNRVLNDNVESVKQFYRQHDTNSSYQCYFDPNDPSFALLDVIVLSTVINGLFWPSLAFVIGIIIFFVQIFHVDSKKVITQQKQFSSLERQWARIKERSYGRMTSTGSERLVPSEGVDTTSHNVVCLQH